MTAPTHLIASTAPYRPSPRARRTSRTLLLVLLAGLALSGCDAPTPAITWFGNRTSVEAGPRLYCTLTNTPAPSCSEIDGPQATLALHADDPVQVNIPAEVAAAPWVLVYSYVGDTQSYRTPVDTSGGTLSFVIRPLPGKQLQQVDLQVLIVTADAKGAPVWTPLQAWVLAVTPA